MKIGYARVSTGEQNLDTQVDQLRLHGCMKIYEETGTGSIRNRPELDNLLTYLRENDTVVVVKLDRLSRSLRDLLDLTDRIHSVGADLQSLSEAIDTTTSSGKLMFHIFGILAEFERERIRERTKEGLKSAKVRGRSGGRPFALNLQQRTEALRMKEEGRSIGEIAELFGVSRQTIRRLSEEQVNQSA